MDYKWVAFALFLALSVQSLFYMNAKKEVQRQEQVISELRSVLTPSQRAKTQRQWNTRQDMMDPSDLPEYRP